VLSLGGNHITNDIAVGLRTPAAEAEKIKLKYGCALSSLVQKDETIEVPSVGGRPDRIMSRQILAEIIEPRVEEIFALVQQDIQNSGYADLVASGMVLTGGSSLLEGIGELAEQVFNLPVRQGNPEQIGGLGEVVKSPIYATGVGLVLHGKADQGDGRFSTRDNTIYTKVKGRMKDWLAEIF
jgi:cell division protein FtsA